MARKALVVIADGFEDVEAVAPVDVLNRVGVGVTIAGLNDTKVKGAYGVTILADCTLDEVSGDYDAIIFPGGLKNAQSLAADERVRRLAQTQAESGRLVAAICAAPSHVLGGSADILRGKNATGDPGFNAELAEYGAVVTGDCVTETENMITATGPGSALQFALTVARYLVGSEKPDVFAGKWGIKY